MQGILTITQEWKDVNTLSLRDINGKALSLGAVSGDILKIYNAKDILIWQGDAPTNSRATEGSIKLVGDVIEGIGANKVYLKTIYQPEDVVIELVKGA